MSAVRIRALTTLLATGAVATAALGAPSPASAACHAGVHPFGSVVARTFCGHASAKVTIAGVTTTFKGGMCTRRSRYVAVNLGTIVLGNTRKKRPAYFGLTVGAPAGGTPAPTDGTYPDAVVAFVIKGKRGALRSASVTLAGGRTRGTFTGLLMGPDTPVTGSFRCR